MENDKILSSLNEISDGVKSVKGTVEGLDKRVTALETKEPEAKAVAVKDAPEFKALQDEIVNLKSINIHTPEGSAKALTGLKVSFMKALIGSHMRKDPGIMGDFLKNNVNLTGVASPDVAGAMGYFIPPEMANAILNLSNEMNFSLMPLVTTLPMTGDKLLVNNYVNGITAGMIGAHTAITDTAPCAEQVTLTAKKIAAMVYYDNEMLADVTPGLLAEIEKDAAGAFAYRENFMALKGSGASDYANAAVTGVLNAPDVNVVTMASGDTDFVDLTADHLTDLIDAIPVPIEQGYFVLSKSLRPTLRKLKSSTSGVYVFTPAGNGDSTDRLFGEPIIWVLDRSPSIMPKLSETAANTAFVAYGDPKKIIKGDRMTLEIALDASPAFTTYQTIVRWVKRMDMKVYGRAWSILKTHA